KVCASTKLPLFKNTPALPLIELSVPPATPGAGSPSRSIVVAPPGEAIQLIESLAVLIPCPALAVRLKTNASRPSSDNHVPEGPAAALGPKFTPAGNVGACEPRRATTPSAPGVPE